MKKNYFSKIRLSLLCYIFALLFVYIYTIPIGLNENENVIHKQPQDIKYEWPQPMSKLKKLSDMVIDCQGGETRDAKWRNLDMSLTDGQTLFMNTPSSYLQHDITIKT